MIGGPLRDWLGTSREALNARFRQAHRRNPRLDPRTVLALCRELLPPLAGEQLQTELLEVVYDLILLHAGRSLLGAGSAHEVLLRETFPRLRELLSQRPRQLPGALSNAVEHLGERGVVFARTMASLGGSFTDPQQVLDAGAVLAWRLGEARLRESALKLARQLPDVIVLRILFLENRPTDSADKLITALGQNAWRFSAWETDRPSGSGEWSLVARLGEFEGFGGRFLEPPLLLDAGEQTTPYRFWVRSGEKTYRLDADVFGWVCRPALVHGPVSKLKGRKSAAELSGATSAVENSGVIAYTLADSFRVRVLLKAFPH
jgi:hypothetical protein